MHFASIPTCHASEDHVAVSSDKIEGKKDQDFLFILGNQYRTESAEIQKMLLTHV